MRHWSLSRVVWVADRGFTSAENRRYLRRGGNHHIFGEKLRSGSAEAHAALSRQGRYQEVAGNLRVKEVRIAEDEWFVICHNPEAAERDAASARRIPARQTPHPPISALHSCGTQAARQPPFSRTRRLHQLRNPRPTAASNTRQFAPHSATIVTTACDLHRGGAGGARPTVMRITRTSLTQSTHAVRSKRRTCETSRPRTCLRTNYGATAHPHWPLHVQKWRLAHERFRQTYAPC
jgi:hypothetical protein